MGFLCLLLLPVLLQCCVNAALVRDIRNEYLDVEYALEMCTLSDLVYSLNANNVNDAVPSKYSVLSWIDDGPVEALVVNSTEKFIVAFRGSEEPQDFIVNVDIAQTNFGPEDDKISPGGMRYVDATGNLAVDPIQVHRGFNTFFDSAFEQVLQVIKAYSPKVIHMTGHSLGAAHAGLLAPYFAFHNPLASVYLTTFGQPRTGNRGYKILSETLRNLNYWRLVHQNDLVTRGPFANYFHAGHLMWKRPNNGQVMAYYRTVGSQNLRYDGINDFSIACK